MSNYRESLQEARVPSSLQRERMERAAVATLARRSEPHLVAIETKLRMDARVDGDPDSLVFRPTCVCGWVGPRQHTWYQERHDAIVEGRLHLIAAVGCADALPFLD
jgi:hypothetical protein